jgi:hypothetical protein
MLITRTPVTIPTQSLGWSLLGALLVSHLSTLGTSKTNTAGCLDRSGYYHHICRTAHFAHYHLYMRLCQRESVLRPVLLMLSNRLSLPIVSNGRCTAIIPLR